MLNPLFTVPQTLDDLEGARAAVQTAHDNALSALSLAATKADSDAMTAALSAKADAAAFTALLAGKSDSVDVSSYGAKGDGATDDTLAIQAAIATGKTVRLREGKVYVYSGELALLPGQTFEGNATLFRRAQISTTTTAAITAGTTTQVAVADASQFRVGMHVALASATTVRSALTINSTLSGNHRIESISGNTLTLKNSPSISLPSGALVYLSFHGILMANDSEVRNVRFDGNRAAWPWSRWETVSEINTNGAQRTRVQSCRFSNSPGEGALVGGNHNVFRSCDFTTLNGNGIHFSGASFPVCDDVVVNGANLDTATGHADGCIIWSNQISDASISNCYCEGGISGIGSINSTDNSDVSISNCTIRNCTVVGIDIRCGTLNNAPANIAISNCRVTNSGVGIQASHSQPATTAWPSGIDIVNCILENNAGGSLVLNNARDVNVSNLLCKGPIGASTVYHVLVNDCKRVSITGGSIRGFGYGVYTQSSSGLTEDVVVNGVILTSQYSGALRFQTAGMPNCLSMGCVVSNDATADATNYVGAYIDDGSRIQGCTFNLARGLRAITHAGNNAQSVNNNVKVNLVAVGANPVMGSIQTIGGSSGNLIVFNNVNTAINNVGGTANVSHSNVDSTRANSSAVTDLMSGGNTTADVTSQGPGNSIGLRLAPKGSGSLVLGKHVQTSLVGNPAPTLAAGAGAGTSPTISLPDTPTDTSGKISITTGTAPSAGTLGTLTFGNAFNPIPRVMITPANAAAAALVAGGVYPAATGTKFDIITASVPAASTLYLFNYWVIQ